MYNTVLVLVPERGRSDGKPAVGRPPSTPTKLICDSQRSS